EHGKRVTARPHGVVDLAERRDVVRVELHRALQRLPQRDLRQRVGRCLRRRHRSLQGEEQRQHQSPSAVTGCRRRTTERYRRPGRLAIQWNTDGSTRYATGTTNSVSAVEKKTPPTMA